jgi:hypothetical protein
MKFNNKWTYSLVAIGAVSLASAVRADEAKMSPLDTALSNTTVSGSVSASANWEFSPSSGSVAHSPAGNIPFQTGKANGFNLDVVRLTIAKPQDESPWASGYQIDLMFGPDAVNYNPSTGASVSGHSADFAIKQAYVALRTPVGNGIDWKFGVFDTIIGYEVTDAGNNPNYTRSWGYAVEPTEHTGILATYKINDMFTVSAGVANTLIAGINARNGHLVDNEGDPNVVNNGAWHKTFMGSMVFTAPSSCGWAAGSSLYAGMIYGWGGFGQDASDGNNDSQGGNQINYYLGATINTPVKALTVGAAFDYVQNLGGGANNFTTMTTVPSSAHINDYIFGVYANYKATDKLSLNARAEYWEVDAVVANEVGSDNGISLTGTVEYDLWANVISRVEVRYDQVMSGTWSSLAGYRLPNGAQVDTRTSIGLYANVIYKF